MPSMTNQDRAQPDPLLPTSAAAEFLGVKAQTLEAWRSRRTVDLPFVKVGRCVRYRVSDLQRFVAERVVAA